MITLPYEVVDVFTDRPFTGNPLAVVFGAEQLATEQLQTVTREFNLSETVFIRTPGLHRRSRDCMTPTSPDGVTSRRS